MNGEQMTLEGAEPRAIEKAVREIPRVTDDIKVKVIVERNGEPVIEKEVKAEVYASQIAKATSVVIPGLFCSLDKEGGEVWTR